MTTQETTQEQAVKIVRAVQKLGKIKFQATELAAIMAIKAIKNAVPLGYAKTTEGVGFYWQTLGLRAVYEKETVQHEWNEFFNRAEDNVRKMSENSCKN